MKGSSEIRIKQCFGNKALQAIRETVLLGEKGIELTGNIYVSEKAFQKIIEALNKGDGIVSTIPKNVPELPLKYLDEYWHFFPDKTLCADAIRFEIKPATELRFLLK